MYIWGYQTPVFIPNLYDRFKITSFLVKFFHFQGTNVHLGLPNSSFHPNRVKKNIFSEIFPFLGNKCTFGGSVFIPIDKKNFIFSEIFHFQGKNVHLGVPNSSFYPQFVRQGQKKFIFSEIFPFLGNKCTFRGTKVQFLSPLDQKNFFFSEVFPFLGNKCTFGGTKLQFLSPICMIR